MTDSTPEKLLSKEAKMKRQDCGHKTRAGCRTCGRCFACCVGHRSAPTKDDCHMLDAIMVAAKQIHAEFDCLSDHVMTARQIREQIAAIIWKHIDRRKRVAELAAPETPAKEKS